MLAVMLTDADVDRETWQAMFARAVDKTFNRVSVDGDTSTNDTILGLANGASGIRAEGEDAALLEKGLTDILGQISYMLVKDGEGASKLVTCKMHGARSEESAERLAKAVVGSPLVKAAMFGADANWGRVLCAMGYSKAPFRPEYVDISFSSAVGAVAVCRGGMGLDFDEEAARSILSQDEVVIDVHLHEGEHEATCWGCDLTYEYVKINGDYRT